MKRGTVSTVKRKFSRSNNSSNLKQGLIVTSTPIKSRPMKELNMEFVRLSPVENKSYKSPNLLVPTNNNVNKSTAHSQSIRNDNNLETNAVDKSVNKSKKEIEDSALNNINTKPNNKVVRSMMIMNSDDEEEFWRNRNEPNRGKTTTIKSNRPLIKTQRSFRKIKVQEQAKDVNSAHTAEETIINSQDHRITLPKITAETSKAVPVIKEVTPKVILRETVNGIELRRSNRKRCKPLEFWNGERMEINRDLTDGIRRPVTEKALMKSKAKEIQNRKKIKLVTTELNHRHQVPTIISNVAYTDEPETNLNNGGQLKNIRKSALSSRQRPRSRANVRFSNIGTGTMIDGPMTKNILRPDWVINFPGIFTENKVRPLSDDCIVLPGLNTAMGLISSAIMQMRAKSISQCQAPELYHLIFCVMMGTVIVKINEISAQMETFGHFTVPCGVSYTIENIGKQKAILSFFKISNSRVSK